MVKPQLRNIPGVTEINSIGGYAKEYLVAPNTEQLASYGLSLTDIMTALDRNNANIGAGYIERKGEQYLIRAPGQVQSVDDIGNVLLTAVNGQAIRVRDVAEVSIGRELRTGAATDNGKEVVLGTAFMLIGENSRTVSLAVSDRIAAISKTLPEGVKLITVYDRSNLVDKAIATVKKNLLEGATLVIVILFLFLGNIRAALITAMVIPLSMLFTFTGMVTYKVSANLMSLGALDFGIIIDGAVVIVENCVRRLSHAQAHQGRPLTRSERFHEVFAAAREARRPLLFGQLIIMVVYLPIFALTGVEGRMFHPMALTVVLALLGAMILSVTFVPAAVALFMGNKVAEKENRLMSWAKRRYEPLLDMALRRTPRVLIAATVFMVACGVLASRMGSEFIPSLNEGDMAIQALRIPGTSLSQSLEMQKQLEVRLKEKFPEIERIFARTGTAEIASDPMPPNISDGYIMLKPMDQWPKPRKTHAELLAAIQEEAGKMPGNNYEFSQPIQLRFNELISGVRSDGREDLRRRQRRAQPHGRRSGRVAEQDPGRVRGQGRADHRPAGAHREHRPRPRGARLSLADVQDTLAIAVGGRAAGTYYQGDRRFDIVVRLPESVRESIPALRKLPIALPKADGQAQTAYIPLSEVASLDLSPGPNQVSRENGKRRIVISANVRGRDLGSFVSEAAEAIERDVKIPAGYWTTWGGTFEQLQSAAQRLQIVVPAALVLVFALLFAMFGNVRTACWSSPAFPSR